MHLVASLSLSPNEAYSKKQNRGKVTDAFAAKIHLSSRRGAGAQRKTDIDYPE
jgi:hypothetical protein